MSARYAYPGETIVIGLVFLDDLGQEYSPASIDPVRIYDAEVGGNLIDTLSVSQISTGRYTATWQIPSNLAVGLYYDEWTYVSATGLAANKIRAQIQVDQPKPALIAVQSNLEARLLSIEKRIYALQTAVNNVAYKKDLNAINLLMQKTDNELDQKIQTLDARISLLETYH